MSSSLRRKCEYCGRSYSVDRYNQHRQKYCKRKECVQARKRASNRKHYNSKYHSNPSFCQRERIRCKNAMALIRTRHSQDFFPCHCKNTLLHIEQEYHIFLKTVLKLVGAEDKDFNSQFLIEVLKQRICFMRELTDLVQFSSVTGHSFEQ